MNEVFVSYRRSDSQMETGRIYDSLTACFGRAMVFKDVFSIGLGKDFREVIGRAVGECRVLLAVIGDDWLEARGADGSRRLDDPDDYVRVELETALARKVPVIPVLVGRADMPHAEQLPESLREIAYRNGTRVRPDPDFQGDIERLAGQVRSYLSTTDRVVGLVRTWVTRRTVLGVAVAVSGIGGAFYCARPPADFDLVEDGTGQAVIRDFELLYYPKGSGGALASTKGFGGRCRVPDNFTRLEAVQCYGYDLDRVEGRRLVLRRDPDEFEKAIRPIRDTYDVPSPSEFELASRTKIDLERFSLTVENATSSYVDLLSLYHDPRDGALVADSWELTVPPFAPHEVRNLADFRRNPGYFVLFVSTQAKTAQQLISANLYSGLSPKLKITATSDGFAGRLTW